MWVKICGVTNVEDAIAAADAGANAVGFIFVADSKRRVTPEQAAAIGAKLPKGVERFGVFVASGVEEVLETARQADLTGVQLYVEDGATSLAQDFTRTKLGKLKVVVAQSGDALADENSIAAITEAKRRVWALLLDSAKGGSGERFDWRRARHLVETAGLLLPVIVAGGLTPTNVGDAVRTFHPFGVDVASG